MLVMTVEQPKISPAANHPPVFDLSTGFPRKSTTVSSFAPPLPSCVETKTCQNQERWRNRETL